MEYTTMLKFKEFPQSDDMVEITFTMDERFVFRVGGEDMLTISRSGLKIRGGNEDPTASELYDTLLEAFKPIGVF